MLRQLPEEPSELNRCNFINFNVSCTLATLIRASIWLLVNRSNWDDKILIENIIYSKEEFHMLFSHCRIGLAGMALSCVSVTAV